MNSVIKMSDDPKQIGLKKECRKLAVLIAIDTIPNVSQDEIIECIGINERAFRYVLGKLKVDAGVKIERIIPIGDRANTYKIQDSGIFDLKKLPFMLEKKCPQVLTRIVEYAKVKSMNERQEQTSM